MSQLSLATKPALINSFADSPVQFITAPTSTSQSFVAATSVNAATAVGVRISGFGDFYLTDLRYVRAVKPTNGTKNKITVDSTDATQIVVAANLPAGSAIVFHLLVETDDSRGEFDSWNTRDQRIPFPYQYITKGNDTAADVLQGLQKAISGIATLFPEADGAGEPWTATYAGGVFALEAADDHLTLHLSVDDLFLDNKAQVPVFAPVTATDQFGGRGTYTILHNKFHETDGSNEIYSHSKRTNLPVRNSLYNCFNFGTGTERDDLSGHGAAGSSVFQKADFELYTLNSSDNDAINDALATFFDRIPNGKKEFILGDTPGTADTVANWKAAAIVPADPTVEDPSNN